MNLFLVTTRRQYTEKGLEINPRRDGNTFEDYKSYSFSESADAIRERYANRRPASSDAYWAERFTDSCHDVQPVSDEQYEYLKESAHRSAAYWGDRVCCDKAILGQCVCRYMTVCPEHGSRCHGSHD